MDQELFDSLVPFTNAVADYGRWKRFVARDDDVFVCTPAKCGTTWTQTICCNLIRPDGDFPSPVSKLSPWIEAIFGPEDEMHESIRKQAMRRILKSHSPAESIPWYENAKYIFVVRDGRDAFMSMVNHNERMKFLDDVNRRAQERGVPEMPKYNGDPHEFFKAWIERGSGYFDLVASYWQRRDRDNLLLVHYADLKNDLEGEIRRIADYLDIGLTDDKFAAVTERCTFEYMREHPEMVGEFEGFEGGIKGFIFKGQNNRWKEVLTEAELATYQDKLNEFLPADAVAWINKGREAFVA
jgi:aryl sulfotransferase